MSQPLAGVCVLEFSTLLPGPLATSLLACPALGEDNELIENRGAP